MYFEKIGIKADIVENGKLAIDKAMSQSFDLILMDMQMPVMGGLEATRILRSKGYKGAIIALTANTMELDIKACSDAGYDDFLAKPIDRAKFYGVLNQRLVPALDHSNNFSPVFSTLLDEDQKFSDMVAKYIDQLPGIIFDIAKANQERDLESLRFKIHDLISTGGGYGYPMLTELANRINVELRQDNYESVSSLIESLREYSNRIISGIDACKETREL